MLNGAKRYLTDRRYLLLIAFATIFLFALLLKFTVRIPGTDDYVFQQMIAPYHNVVSWVSYRYHSWSGRIFSEALVYIFSPISLRWWKIASLLGFIALSIYSYLFYLLYSKRTHNYLALATCSLLPFLMNSVALFDGMFWVTGAINYFWITTLGLIGFYPFAYYFTYRKLPSGFFTIVGVVAGVIAACSQEQVGALLVGLSVAGTLYLHYEGRFKSFSWPPILYTLLFAGPFAFSILAPGNRVRVQLETARWLPTFYQVPILHRIDYSYRWLLDAVINHTGVLIPIIFILYFMLAITKKQKDKVDYATIIALGTVALLMSFKGYDQLAYLFNFYATWQPVIPDFLGKIIIYPWTFVLLLLVLAPIIIFRKQRSGWVLAIVTAAFLCSIAAICLSPTLYASGWRTLYIPSITLSMMLLYLLWLASVQYKRAAPYIYGSLFVLAAAQYLFILIKLLTNAHISLL